MFSGSMNQFMKLPQFKDMFAKLEDIKRREQKKANREKYSYLLDPTTDSFNPNQIDQQLLVDLRNLDFLSQPSALAPRKQKPSALVGIPVFDTDITRQLYGEENV
jgi:hypothetical protein